MPDALPVADQIAEIESRQDEVLRQLDELNLLLERAIADWMGKTKSDPPSTNDMPALKVA